MKLKNILSLSTLLYSFHTIYAQPLNIKDTDASIQNSILIHINEYRQHKGLSPLQMDATMVREAKIHSMDMASHKIPFGHQYFSNRIKILHSQIKNSTAGAENVAYNYKDAQDVVNNWLRSPGHKANIDGPYNLTGIGIARDQQGKMYFTQIFLRTNANSHYASRREGHAFFHIPFIVKKT